MKKMKIDEIINDLKAIGEYFETESGGCIPVCIPEAIKVLESLNTLKEVLHD